MKNAPGRAPLLGCLLALAPLSSCVIPIGGAEVGDLRVTWSFDGSQRCADVGVENVTVQLIEKGKEGQGALAFGQTAACIEGSMELIDVTAGTYTMTVVGDGEQVTFNNGEGIDVVVAPNQPTDVEAGLEIVIDDVTANLLFRVQFPDGIDCAAAGVANINAQVLTGDPPLGIAGINADCVASEFLIEGVRLGEHTLRVDAVDGNGTIRFSARVPVRGLQPGDTFVQDTVVLSPELVTTVVRYTFDGNAFCAQAGVAAVDAQLRDSDGNVVDGQNVACVAGRIEFAPVRSTASLLADCIDASTRAGDADPEAECAGVGTYSIHLDGIDGNQQVQFTADEDDLALNNNREQLTIDLEPLSSSVTVRFTLPEGESCASLGVANVDVRIVDAAGGTTGENVACVAGQVILLGPAPGNATIVAEGIAGDEVVLSATAAATLRSGRDATNTINLALAPTQTELTVSWTFNIVVDDNVADAVEPEVQPASRSCVESDVDAVLVRVLRGNTLIEAVETACSAGQVEIPNIPLAGGNVTVELEGLRLQEGDSIFEERVTGVALSGARSTVAATLEPSIVFARVIWTGDCGVANANTVDIQVSANGVSEGINIACATGTTTIALPPGTQNSLVTISLRGVDGQGAPVGVRQTIDSATVSPGVETFRFTGPQ